MTHKINNPISRAGRRHVAKANAEQRKNRSAAAQISLLDERLGINEGASDERARLRKIAQ